MNRRKCKENYMKLIGDMHTNTDHGLHKYKRFRIPRESSPSPDNTTQCVHSYYYSLKIRVYQMADRRYTPMPTALECRTLVLVCA